MNATVLPKFVEGPGNDNVAMLGAPSLVPLPVSLEAERAVLSAVLLDPTRIAEVAFLRAEQFYKGQHRSIFEAVTALSNDGEKVDVVTVATWLKDRQRLQQAGGSGFIASVLDGSPHIPNVVSHANIIRDCHRRREIVRRATDIAIRAHGQVPDVADFASRAADELRGVVEGAGDAWADRVVSVQSDMLRDPPPARQWLLRDRRTPDTSGVLPLGKVGQLAAAGGVGKTQTLLQLAMAVATGSTWLGCLDVSTPGRVLALLAEEDAEEVHRRLYDARKSLGARAPAPGDLVVLPLAGASCDFVLDDGRGNVVDGPFLVWLRRWLATQPPFALVILDPLSRFAGRDAEKDNHAATRFVAAAESIAIQTGATVVVSHHTGQRARGGGALDATASRGVTALVDGVRWAATLSAERIDGLEDDARERLREVVTLSFVKSNYSRKGDPIQLRRDLDHGGALVPLDAVDVALLAAARDASNPGTVREAAKQSRGRSKVNALGDVVRAVLAQHPEGLSYRALRAGVQAINGTCTDPALHAAVAALGSAVSTTPGPRGATIHRLLEVA